MTTTDMDRITAATLHELSGKPGTVLVLQPAGEHQISYDAVVTTPAEIAAGQAPVYLTSWGPEGADGLCSEVRTYITHAEIQRRATVAAVENPQWDTDRLWDELATDLTGAAEVVWQRARRGDDALADDDNWAQYVA